MKLLIPSLLLTLFSPALAEHYSLKIDFNALQQFTSGPIPPRSSVRGGMGRRP